MDIGIGLPATIPGISGSLIKEWAVRAENGPFSTLGIVDRIVYPNHEPMISLAATSVLIMMKMRFTGLIETVQFCLRKKVSPSWQQS